jgi:hypothetical protein
VGLAVLQIRRYEGGASQPTLHISRKLSIALGISADMLVFDAEERKPDELLRYQFEMVSRLSAHEQDIVRELLDAVIIKIRVTGAIARITTPSTKEKLSARTGSQG